MSRPASSRLSRVFRQRSFRAIRRLVALTALCAIGSASTAFAQGCNADLNGDGRVDGADLATVLSNWGACPATISAVAPAQGSVLGGTVITLTGTGLAGTSSVTVGGAPCTGVTVLSPTQVRATTPPGTAGQAAIAVTTPVGTSLASTPFTYVMQSVTSIVPPDGTYAGGTAITISGQYLAGTTAVTIGGVPATNVVAVNATTVTAVTPPGSVGAVDVIVVGTKGVLTVTGGFTYRPYTVPSWATLLEGLPDPTVVTSAAFRAAIIATGRPWRVRDNSTQIEMVLIPPGTFGMGCSASTLSGCASDESPVHSVTLTNAFYLGRYEVTQAQWTARMGSNPSYFQGAAYPDAANRPVEQVSWNMCQSFLSAAGLRFPTEAEWEFACRAGTTTAFHSLPGQPGGTNDDALIGSIAWFVGNNGPGGSTTFGTKVVGQKAANGFGLHDMSGNVYEWVGDWYSENFYASSPSANPAGPASGTARVLRGGSCFLYSWLVRSSARSADAPGSPVSDYGLRVARNAS